MNLIINFMLGTLLLLFGAASLYAVIKGRNLPFAITQPLPHKNRHRPTPEPAESFSKSKRITAGIVFAGVVLIGIAYLILCLMGVYIIAL